MKIYIFTYKRTTKTTKTNKRSRWHPQQLSATSSTEYLFFFYNLDILYFTYLELYKQPPTPLQYAVNQLKRIIQLNMQLSNGCQYNNWLLHLLDFSVFYNSSEKNIIFYQNIDLISVVFHTCTVQHFALLCLLFWCIFILFSCSG